jgi:hypothetical protein
MNFTPETYMRFYRTALIVMISFTATAAYAQSGCNALDTTAPLLYMSFDGSDKEQIWLTLHNNMTCGIQVLTNDELKERRMLWFADGSSKIEIRSSIQLFNRDFVDNEVVRDLIYDLRDFQTDRIIKNTSTHQLEYVRRIPSGVNVRVSIPFSSRKLGWKLGVGFTYDWESEDAPAWRAGAAHRLYFSFPETDWPRHHPTTRWTGAAGTCFAS